MRPSIQHPPRAGAGPTDVRRLSALLLANVGSPLIGGATGFVRRSAEEFCGNVGQSVKPASNLRAVRWLDYGDSYPSTARISATTSPIDWAGGSGFTLGS